MLRDLWQWQRPVDPDPVLDRVVRGDVTLLDDVDALPAGVVERAAVHGRWELVVGLVERGAPLATTGRTALHAAAGAGELAVVEVLVEHGAALDVTDPEYHATPLRWAEFLRHADVAAYLRAREG